MDISTDLIAQYWYIHRQLPDSMRELLDTLKSKDDQNTIRAVVISYRQ